MSCGGGGGGGITPVQWIEMYVCREVWEPTWMSCVSLLFLSLELLMTRLPVLRDSECKPV